MNPTDFPDKCLACGHHRQLHAPIGRDAKPGAKCVTCQCAGLEVACHRCELEKFNGDPCELHEDNGADERAEGGA